MSDGTGNMQLSEMRKMEKQLEPYRDLIADLRKRNYICVRHDDSKVYLQDSYGHHTEVDIQLLLKLYKLGVSTEFHISCLMFDNETEQFIFSDQPILSENTRKFFNRITDTLDKLDMYNRKLSLLGKQGQMQFQINEFSSGVVLKRCDETVGDYVKIPSFVTCIERNCFKDTKAKYIYIDNDEYEDFTINSGAFQFINVPELTVEFSHPERIKRLQGAFMQSLCSKVTIKNFDWQNIERADKLFEESQNLEEFDLGSGICQKLVSFSEQFSRCYKLRDIQSLKKLLFPKLVNLSLAFSWCQKLRVADVQTLFIQKDLTDVQRMFEYCKQLKNVKLTPTKFDIDTWYSKEFTGMQEGLYKDLLYDAKNGFGEIQNIYDAFGSCKQLEQIDLSGLNLRYLIDAEQTFEDCRSLKEVKITENYKVIYSDKTYSNPSIEQLKASGELQRLAVTRLYNVASMFANCEQIKYADLQSLDLCSLHDLDNTFEGCSSLITVKFGKARLSSLVEMEETFLKCKSLIKIDLSNVCAPKLRWLINTFTDVRDLKEVRMPKESNKKLMFRQVFGMQSSTVVSRNRLGLEQVITQDEWSSQDEADHEIEFIEPIDFYVPSVCDAEVTVGNICSIVFEKISDSQLMVDKVCNRIRTLHLKDRTYEQKELRKILEDQIHGR